MRTSASAVTRDREHKRVLGGYCTVRPYVWEGCGRCSHKGKPYTVVYQYSVGVWGECVFLLHVGVSVLRLTLRPYTFISSVYALRLY